MAEEFFSGNYMENFAGAESREMFPGPVEECKRDGNKFYFYALNAILELTVVSDLIFRFRFSNDYIFDDDFSYAIDDKFDAGASKIEIEELTETFVITTAALRCHISKNTLRQRIENLDGLVILEDEKGYHWFEDKAKGGNIVINTKKTQVNENFFGLGE